jgi:BlaI family penicillinase repressor
VKAPRISEAEWAVMEVLWQGGSLTSAEVIERLPKDRKWAANTVRTLLARLMRKKHVRSSRREGKYRYEPVLTREQGVEREGRSFLGRIFGGRTAPLLLHFAREAQLTPEETRELRTLLNRKGRHE